MAAPRGVSWDASQEHVDVFHPPLVLHDPPARGTNDGDLPGGVPRLQAVPRRRGRAYLRMVVPPRRPHTAAPATRQRPVRPTSQPSTSKKLNMTRFRSAGIARVLHDQQTAVTRPMALQRAKLATQGARRRQRPSTAASAPAGGSPVRRSSSRYDRQDDELRVGVTLAASVDLAQRLAVRDPLQFKRAFRSVDNVKGLFKALGVADRHHLPPVASPPTPSPEDSPHYTVAGASQPVSRQASTSFPFRSSAGSTPPTNRLSSFAMTEFREGVTSPSPRRPPSSRASPAGSARTSRMFVPSPSPRASPRSVASPDVPAPLLFAVDAADAEQQPGVLFSDAWKRLHTQDPRAASHVLYRSRDRVQWKLAEAKRSELLRMALGQQAKRIKDDKRQHAQDIVLHNAAAVVMHSPQAVALRRAQSATLRQERLRRASATRRSVEVLNYNRRAKDAQTEHRHDLLTAARLKEEHQRCWITLLRLAQSTQHLCLALILGRTKFLSNAAALFVQRVWRGARARKYLHLFRTSHMVLRRSLWYCRFHHRIRFKRKAVRLLRAFVLDFPLNRAPSSLQLHVRRFRQRVVVCQRVVRGFVAVQRARRNALFEWVAKQTLSSSRPGGSLVATPAREPAPTTTSRVVTADRELELLRQAAGDATHRVKVQMSPELPPASPATSSPSPTSSPTSPRKQRRASPSGPHTRRERRGSVSKSPTAVQSPRRPLTSKAIARPRARRKSVTSPTSLGAPTPRSAFKPQRSFTRRRSYSVHASDAVPAPTASVSFVPPLWMPTRTMSPWDVVDRHLRAVLRAHVAKVRDGRKAALAAAALMQRVAGPPKDLESIAAEAVRRRLPVTLALESVGWKPPPLLLFRVSKPLVAQAGTMQWKKIL